MKNYKAREMQVKIFEKGELVYDEPSLDDIAEYRKEEVESLWDEVKRYYVDLSQKLWNLKQKLILEAKSK